MLNIDNKYDIGQIVYLKTDTDQFARMVTAITVTKDAIVYNLSLGISDSKRYDIEISESADILKTV